MSLTNDGSSKHELNAAEDANLVVHEESWHCVVCVDYDHAGEDDEQAELVVQWLILLLADVREHDVGAHVLLEKA